jgi:F0F1-type ATP synthase delta subunit
MTQKEISAKVIKVFKTEKDEILKILRTIELTKEQDIKALIETYLKIKNGEIRIVEVKSSVELSVDQKKTLEEKLSKQIKEEIVFDYEVDTNVKGLEVSVGDNKLKN